MKNSCCFQNKKQLIIDTMHKFYLCTNLPIQALSTSCELMHSEGYTNEYDTIIDEYQEVKAAIKGITQANDQNPITLSFANMELVVIPICLQNTNNGIYLIGPYTSAIGDDKFVYKPKDCLPHLITLLRNISQSSEAGPLKDDSFGIYVRKSLEYIDSNYSDPITVDCVSNKLGISKCYFCTLFKKETGKTFTQVLNEVRVEKSKKLLKESSQTILDVAISVGYNNQNYYNMIFKKLNDTTPHHFRKQNT